MQCGNRQNRRRGGAHQSQRQPGGSREGRARSAEPRSTRGRRNWPAISRTPGGNGRRPAPQSRCACTVSQGMPSAQRLRTAPATWRGMKAWVSVGARPVKHIVDLISHTRTAAGLRVKACGVYAPALTPHRGFSLVVLPLVCCGCHAALTNPQHARVTCVAAWNKYAGLNISSNRAFVDHRRACDGCVQHELTPEDMKRRARLRKAQQCSVSGDESQWHCPCDLGIVNVRSRGHKVPLTE
jgi:hypothetical protein